MSFQITHTAMDGKTLNLTVGFANLREGKLGETKHNYIQYIQNVVSGQVIRLRSIASKNDMPCRRAMKQRMVLRFKHVSARNPLNYTHFLEFAGPARFYVQAHSTDRNARVRLELLDVRDSWETDGEHVHTTQEPDTYEDGPIAPECRVVMTQNVYAQ